MTINVSSLTVFRVLPQPSKSGGDPAILPSSAPWMEGYQK